MQHDPRVDALNRYIGEHNADLLDLFDEMSTGEGILAFVSFPDRADVLVVNVARQRRSQSIDDVLGTGPLGNPEPT